MPEDHRATTKPIKTQRSITSMMEDMSSQLGSLNETLAAEQTRVGLHASMNTGMPIESLFRGELGETLKYRNVRHYKGPISQRKERNGW